MKRVNILKFLALILFVVVALSAFIYLQGQGIYDVESLRGFIDGYGSLAPLVFIFMYIVFIILFFPGLPITVVSGVLFGTFYGGVYAVIGATIGATIAFFISRKLGRGFVSDLIDEKFTNLKKYDNEIEKHGLKVILFFRLFPIIPFNGNNFGFGLTKIKVRTYLIGTFFGIMPWVFLYTFFGDAIAELNLINMAIVVVLFVVFTIIFLKLNKRRKLKKKNINQNKD
jgi:uncharacterized membrane protein YdjX (TVP38/TMEM64 family)